MLVSTVILPILFAVAPVTASSPGALCPKSAAASDQAKFSRLGDLPPAQAVKAVWRSSDCAAGTILARDRMGPAPKPRR